MFKRNTAWCRYFPIIYLILEERIVNLLHQKIFIIVIIIIIIIVIIIVIIITTTIDIVIDINLIRT